MLAAVHALTPVIGAIDPRGLALRTVDYCRAEANEAAERRIRCSRFDHLGRVVEQWDARLWALHEADPTVPANLRQVHSLGGRGLSRDSVDSGFACTLFGEMGQAVWFEDGKGNRRELEYDPQARPVAIHEQGPEHPRTCSERFGYGGSDASGNGRGCLLRHDDPAGSRTISGYALGGLVMAEARRFLPGDDWPDWPLSLDERDALLEPDAAPTSWRHGPLGEVLEQTDASGNRQAFGQDLAGQLNSVRFQLKDGSSQVALDDARYDAFGRAVEETLGNGVQVRRQYRGEDGVLLRLSAHRSNGQVLQDLHYEYDPLGNVLAIEDRAQPTRHFANQRIEPRCEYRHDSLYQLLQATGWEAGTAARGPDAALDPGAVSNYRQTYRYDAGGNLLELTPVGAQAHGRTLVADAHSNRCLPTGQAFTGGFDANGNLLSLQPGQLLHWDVRNQLCEVRPVTRENAADDCERYRYDSAGQRLRKRHTRLAAHRALTRDTRYLPGLERHVDEATGEHFEVMLARAGSCSVRILHWHAGRPDEVGQDQSRYVLGDHLGSATLELDGEAALISHEVFHPFGSTAWWVARSEVEASYKTLRYCGKERDASGLYYYGARYYRTDWQRWLNPDPAGEVDGLNLYCMVGNAPLNRRDDDGCTGFDVMDAGEKELTDNRDRIVASGLDEFDPAARRNVKKAIRLGRSWAREARRAVRGKRNQAVLGRALESTFGAAGAKPGVALDHVKDRLSITMKRAGRYLKRLRTESWRLIQADMRDPSEHGSTVPTGIAGRGPRIVIASKRATGDITNLAAVLFHESLHALDGHSERIGSEHIFDFWYDLPEAEPGQSMAQLETRLHERLAERVRLGADERSMSPLAQKWYVRMVNECSTALGLAKAVDHRQRRTYFRSRALIRQKVMLHNADTMTGFAMTFHNHRSR